MPSRQSPRRNRKSGPDPRLYRLCGWQVQDWGQLPGLFSRYVHGRCSRYELLQGLSNWLPEPGRGIAVHLYHLCSWRIQKPKHRDTNHVQEHIIKYGASYYIDGGDRGTVKLFSHGTPVGQEVFGSKREFTVGSGATKVSIVEGDAVTNAIDPFITGGSNVGFNSSYYVGAKVITGNPLDQNVEITYVDIANRRLHLSTPLAAVPTNNSVINIIANRPTPLIGLKCRDFITSSQGRTVRNRTQVYPTRLSTGSNALMKVDLLKTPIFQTESVTSGTFSITTATVNIGKRGKAFLLSNVSNNSYLEEGTGAYGYFRGKFEGDASNKTITVLGYLERRLSTTATPAP